MEIAGGKTSKPSHSIKKDSLKSFHSGKKFSSCLFRKKSPKLILLWKKEWFVSNLSKTMRAHIVLMWYQQLNVRRQSYMVCGGGESSRHRNWSLPPSSTISTLGLLNPSSCSRGGRWKSSRDKSSFPANRLSPWPGLRFWLDGFLSSLCAGHSVGWRHRKLSSWVISVGMSSFLAGGSRLVNSKVGLPSPPKLSFWPALEKCYVIKK